ncbi:RidA family protein [Bradyrhizobium canariense]|uniref:RidA family protein n=1 Tax=Bradyrhizobium canariense TaxID=255045 RepID=UPI001CA5B396|nr:RidA family protein [Bradyrhizobium canariense]MBW5434066.1 RidA family protein [Bradyrhizobium canariense]
MIRKIVATAAPPPAGNYSQGIVASGEFLFISGQTPRLADGTRLKGRPFSDDARQVMNNVKEIAEAAGFDLATQCVKIVVYLTEWANKPEFDRVLAVYFPKTRPARTIVQSSFVDFSVELEAVLVR